MTGQDRIVYKLHPYREALYNELHTRPFYELSAPHQISHLAATCEDPTDLAEAYQWLCELCRRYQINAPQPDTVAFHENFGEFVVHWERHAEFYSLTIMQPELNPDNPFHYTAIDLLPEDWMRKLPGSVIAAFHLIVGQQDFDVSPPVLTRYFEGHPIISSLGFGDGSQIFTSFKLHGDGFSRFVVHNNSLNKAQAGQLVRRLIDLETYRLLTLMSLPIAKKIAPQLLIMDKQLAEILTVITNLDDTNSEKELLEKITRIEARLESYRAESNQRFAATKAYHQLVLDRLEGLQEGCVIGYPSLSEFINRRLNPAARTCEAVQVWMDDLSKRIERASDLMRTRANLKLQEHNRYHLEDMNRRSKLQFRLQETVEGLSIAAISYYAVGLLSYLFNGLPLKDWGLSKNVLTAACIPVVVISIWYLTRRIKRRLIKDHSED